MLDAKQLEAFASAVELGSLGAAASKLRITLAAVSLRIKSLESTLGQRLLVRGKTTQATRAGQTLLAHIRRSQLLEAELAERLSESGATGDWHTLHVAVNSDSLASWFLPGIQETLSRHRILLHTVVDDQEHTLQWLQRGDVTGCVTQLAQALRGCVAQPLGILRYRCVASPEVAQRLHAMQAEPGADTRPALLRLPALCFNAKDHLQDVLIAQRLGLRDTAYPQIHLPDSEAYRQGLLLGMGWGMLAEVQLRMTGRDDLAAGRLVELFAGEHVDVPLYWHHWQSEAAQAARLSQAVVHAAREYLIQT